MNEKLGLAANKATWININIPKLLYTTFKSMIWFTSGSQHHRALDLSWFGSVNRLDKEVNKVSEGGWGASFAVRVSSVGCCRHQRGQKTKQAPPHQHARGG
jgi:hypothetical protein